MNEERIEKILRKAPSPKAPEDLLRKLAADVRVPQEAARPASGWSSPPTWARRWLPALSVAAILLACFVVVAVQTNKLAELQRQNGELQAAKTNLEALRAESVEYKKLLNENQELERLRKDNAELVRLRAEVAKLQTQLQGSGKLQAENAQIKKQIAASQMAAGYDAEAYAIAMARAERIQCVNNLKQIGLAARLWSGDNNNVYPVNFVCMSNELSTPKILRCPSDNSASATNWAEVAAGSISYIMDAPGIGEKDLEYNPQMVFVECKIHRNICLMDGSVQMLSNEKYRQLKVVDGKKIMAP